MKNNNPIRRILNAVLSRALASLIRRSSLTAVTALLIAGPATTATAQSQLFSHISPEADQVFHIDLKAITSKVSWEDLTNFPFLQKGTEKYQYILKDPSQAGIDVHKDVLLTITSDPVTKKAAITTFIIPLTDSGKFVDFFKKQTPGFEPHDINVIDKRSHNTAGRIAANGNTAIAWTNNLLVVTNIVGDTTYLRRETMHSLLGYSATPYTTNPLFTKGFTDGGDIHMWTKQGEGVHAMIGKIMKVPQATPSNASHILTTLRFEPGKIVIESNTEIAPGYADAMRQLASRPADLSLIKRIPRGEIVGLINIHVAMEGIFSLMEKAHTRQKLDSMLMRSNISLNDIKSAFKGDALLTVVMPNEPPAGPVDTLSSKPAMGTPNVYFVTAIGDTNAYNKLAAKLNLRGDTASFGKMKAALAHRDGLLVVSSNTEAVNAYFSNTQPRDISFLPAQVVQNPFGLYVDFRTVATIMKAMQQNQTGKQGMLTALNALDKLTITGGSFKDNTSQTKFEITLQNASDNSLKTIVNMLKQPK